MPQASHLQVFDTLRKLCKDKYFISFSPILFLCVTKIIPFFAEK